MKPLYLHQPIIGFGDDALRPLIALLHAKKGQPVFLVHGKHSYAACGAEALLEPLFAQFRLQVNHFTDFGSNPEQRDADAGTELFRRSGSRLIVAVGGGSCMDVAKIIRYQSGVKGTTLVTVPTTAGTGAEATRFATIYADGVKSSVENSLVRPDMACVYPPFVYSNSHYQAMCAGFDAMSHAIESYWNLNATEQSEELALQAIREGWNMLLRAAGWHFVPQNGKMSHAALTAGRAINLTRTTAPHAYSYALTTTLRLPHGHAVALTFPFLFDYNVNCPPEEYLGKDYEAYCRKMKRLKLLLRVHNLKEMQQCVKRIFPNPVSFDGFDWDSYFSAVNLQRLGNNPRRVTDHTNQLLKDYLLSSNE